MLEKTKMKKKLVKRNDETTFAFEYSSKEALLLLKENIINLLNDISFVDSGSQFVVFDRIIEKVENTENTENAEKIEKTALFSLLATIANECERRAKELK